MLIDSINVIIESHFIE